MQPQYYDEEHAGLLGNEKTAKANSHSAWSQKWFKRVAVLSSVGVISYMVSANSHFKLASQTLAPLLSATSNALVNPSPQGWAGFEMLFAFGDSYTSYPGQEREEDPPYKCKILTEGERFRQKPNWVTFLTEVYNSTKVTAIDFAEGGSTVDRDMVPPFALGSSLKDETNAFLQSYSRESPALEWDSKSTLFSLFFGINDITMCHVRSNPEGEFQRPPLAKIFESYSISANKLYNAGGRNFLFMAVPPFDRSLAYPADEWHARRQDATIADISDFNARLFDMVADFRQNHSDITAHLFETHRFYSRMISEPTKFPATIHVTNPTGICHEAAPDRQPGPLDIVYDQNICDDGDLIQSYVWTELHATYPVHNATAYQIVQDCFTGGATKGYCH